MKTYSFKDLTGAFTHPLAGDFAFFGQVGLGQITIVMNTEKTTHDVSADGTVMPSAISGDNGQASIEIQQTSILHKFLLDWYNLIKTAMDSNDVSTWAGASMTLRSTTDGSSHVLQGISPAKIPDKPYAAQGQKVTWILMAADIQNTTS